MIGEDELERLRVADLSEGETEQEARRARLAEIRATRRALGEDEGPIAVYLRLAEARELGRGVRLSAFEVETLISLDTAISDAIDEAIINYLDEVGAL